MDKNKNLLIALGIIIAIIIIGAILITTNKNAENQDNNNDNIIYFDEPETMYDLCMDNYQEIAAECEAFKNNDPSICDNFIDENTKAWCKAKVSQDNTYCEVLTPEFEDYEDCYIDTAKTVEDCESIDFFHKDYEKSECLAVVQKDESLCEGPEYDRIACVADATGDASYCDQSDAFLERWDCKIGLQYSEPGICEQYHQEFCMEFYPPEN